MPDTSERCTFTARHPGPLSDLGDLDAFVKTTDAGRPSLQVDSMLPDDPTTADIAAHNHDLILMAAWAGHGLLAFANRTMPGGDEEIETALGDLLGDLMHLCDAADIDFDNVLNHGAMHYESEIRGVL